MDRLILACAILAVSGHASQSPPLQTDAEVQLLDGRVDGASVDHAFRRAFNEQMARADRHYGKQLLRNTYDKMNSDVAKVTKSKMYRALKAHLKGAKEDQTKGINQMMDETENEIKDMSHRADQLHKGVHKLMKDTNWDIDEEEHKAVMRHRKREYEREAELESLQPLSKSEKNKVVLSTAQSEAKQLQGSEEDLKYIFKTKCKQMATDNQRRTKHVSGLISELKLSMKEVDKAFQASSRGVDQAIEHYAKRRKDARMVAHAVDKAEYKKNSPFNQTKTDSKTVEKKASGPQKEGTATTRVTKALAKDSMGTARHIAAKAAMELLRSRSAVHKALKTLDDKKQKVVRVQMSLQQHKALHKRLEDQQGQIENLCKDPLKPDVHSKHDTEFEQAVNKASKTPDKNYTNTNITKLLEETKDFAAQSVQAAADLKQTVVQIKAKSGSKAKTAANPVLQNSEQEAELREEEAEEEQRPKPSPAPIPVPLNNETSGNRSLAESLENWHGNNISHNNGSRLRNGWQYGAPALNPNATSVASAASLPATPVEEEVGEVTIPESLHVSDSVVTLDMCKAAKMGMQTSCKNAGEKSLTCVNARKQYDSQCGDLL